MSHPRGCTDRDSHPHSSSPHHFSHPSPGMKMISRQKQHEQPYISFTSVQFISPTDIPANRLEIHFRPSHSRTCIACHRQPSHCFSCPSSGLHQASPSRYLPRGMTASSSRVRDIEAAAPPETAAAVDHASHSRSHHSAAMITARHSTRLESIASIQHQVRDTRFVAVWPLTREHVRCRTTWKLQWTQKEGGWRVHLAR